MVRRTYEGSMQRWYRGNQLLASPVDGHAVRIVGEDEFRETGTFAALGDNLVFAGRREKVDLEILGLTFQNQTTSIITAQLKISGASISGAWQLAPAQFWNAPGFILMNGQQIFVTLTTAGQFAFMVRWRLYYGRKK